MLRVKLYELLKSNNISSYRFAKAVSQTGLRSENWAYRLLRGELNLTLDSLELVIQLISAVTDKNITVSDILEYRHSSNIEANSQIDNFELSNNIPTPLTIYPEGEIIGSELKFIVNPIESALNYTFSIFHYQSKQIILFKNTRSNIFSPATNALCPNVEYGWKVKVFGFSGWSAFSSTKRFIISSKTAKLSKNYETIPAVPKAISPTGVVTSLRPILKLEEVEFATGYSFYLRDINTDTLFDFEFASKKPQFKLAANIVKNSGRYKWNARSYNCGGFSSSYSKSMIFEVKL